MITATPRGAKPARGNEADERAHYTHLQAPVESLSESR
jgi:hypothetical protein